MHPLLRPTNVVIAVLGAAVVGLGTVVAVDHTRPRPLAAADRLAVGSADCRVLAALVGRVRADRSVQG